MPPSPPPGDLQVLYDADLKLEDEARVQMFTCYGVDPLSKGSVNIRTGALLGIPHSYAYFKASDVNKDLFKMAVNENVKSIDWESEVGESFLDSLLLSDKAKQFGVMREVKYVMTYAPYVDAYLKLTFCFLAYWGGCYFNQHPKFKRAPMSVRLGMYSLIGGTMLTLYIVVADSYYCWRDNKVDRKAARVSEDYADGAVEYYGKWLQRNVAVRNLMGHEGAAAYTPFGNTIHSLRQPHVKLTTRLQNITKIRQALIDNPPAPTPRKSDEVGGKRTLTQFFSRDMK